MENKPKLICFDLNDTLIKENTWYDLNLALGMTPEEDQLLFDLFEEGTLSTEDWMRILLKIYKKRGKASYDLIQKIVGNYTYLPGARETITYLQDKGYELVLISGAMDLLVDEVAKDLNIRFSAANTVFIFDSKHYLEDIVLYGEDQLAKLRHLERYCRILGITITDCVCVGDGANDGELFKATGRGVTFKGSKIENSSWKTIENLVDLQKLF